jgi:(E)-4-hydroxy-3-methylbut-2-enyl-diphosphate synthase
MVYVAGRPDHKQDNDGMVEHIVALVEARAAEIEAAERGKARALEAAE